jgi:hypothetical protein
MSVREEQLRRTVSPPEIREHDVVFGWRAEQLCRLGVDALLALELADLVDWHEVASLVERGCPPDLAVQIVL